MQKKIVQVLAVATAATTLFFAAAKIIRAAYGHGLSLPSSCADNRSRRKRAVLAAGQPRP